jgi:dihydrofolate reductase
MKVSVFVGTSVDGFIARPNGDFGFLLDGSGEVAGYEEFLASVDVIVIGRNTFDTVLKLAEWPVQSITITRVPVLVGEGIPLFDTLPHDVRLRHIATQQYPNGFVRSVYQVVA